MIDISLSDEARAALIRDAQQAREEAKEAVEWAETMVLRVASISDPEALDPAERPLPEVLWNLR